MAKYTIYWLEHSEDRQVTTSNFSQKETLADALAEIEFQRSMMRRGAPISAITMCSEHPEQVGHMGVDSVKDGKTPDGVAYTWVKRRPSEEE